MRKLNPQSTLWANSRCFAPRDCGCNNTFFANTSSALFVGIDHAVRQRVLVRTNLGAGEDGVLLACKGTGQRCGSTRAFQRYHAGRFLDGGNLRRWPSPVGCHLPLMEGNRPAPRHDYLMLNAHHVFDCTVLGVEAHFDLYGKVLQHHFQCTPNCWHGHGSSQQWREALKSRSCGTVCKYMRCPVQILLQHKFSLVKSTERTEATEKDPDLRYHQHNN